MGTVYSMRCIVLYSSVLVVSLSDYTPNNRYKRVISVDNPLSISTTLDLTLPMPDIGSEILVTVPFSLDLPTSSSRSASGRSFSSSSSSLPSRSTMYKTIEKYMSQATGADGHACLLRAMCEASATPLHDEGLLGDAVNFLLTANYATEETNEKLKEYVAAQTQGQLKGDCTEFHADCPISFFRFIDNNITSAV